MKKIILTTAMALVSMFVATAQQAIETPKFGDNWSLGIKGGVTTPMAHYPFFRSMRPVVGLQLDKKITPTFRVGAEGLFGINTSHFTNFNSSHSSKTAFDDSYVGAFGAVNLFNLFGGYPGHTRPFDIEAQAGAGWGHTFENKPDKDINYFGTKAGLNFNFNVSDKVTISVSPSVLWRMTGDPKVDQTTASYDKNRANFNITAGVAYNFGGNGFKTVRPYDQAEVDALNGQLNELRGMVDAQAAENAALAATAASLAAQVEQLKNQPPKVVEQVKVKNNLESVRYVFFKIGSSVIGADQQPNVEMIAAYLNNHPGSKVVIKGYASKDGPEELNIRLANQRANSVKDALMKRYKIPASRIQAEGCGIGEMFEEESWNRVAICILETATK
ncbi:MAG: OmpA family protein [Muribaculaceae bacterium]|nr:OmpA family protein [Muribaculaceae bacterium]